MSLAYAVLVGVLFGVAIYLFMRTHIVDHVFGLIVLGNAANLLVFGGGRLRRGAAPVLDGTTDVSDPLPQALVLTAIVIGFGIVAFATVLVARLRESSGGEEPSGVSAEDGDDE